MNRRHTAARVHQRSTDALRSATSPTMRRAALAVRARYRLATATWRQLPNVLIIGGMRCGTSSLYKYLGHHPNAVPSLRKETEFLTRRYDRQELWWRSNFPLRWRHPTVVFEASPYYLAHPDAPGRAAVLVPDARLVAMLREPADRAYSHWQHMRSVGVEPMGFAEAISSESSRLKDGCKKARLGPELARFFLSYRERGHYAEQLQRWLEQFSADQLLVIESEDFYSDTAKTYADVTDFLALERWAPASFRNYSDPADMQRSEDDVEALAALREHFSQPNEELASLARRVGFEPPSWAK